MEEVESPSADNKMRSIKYILIVTAILAAIGTAYWYFSYYKPNKPKNTATEYIAQLLRDPNSAQFRDVRITKEGTVCGEVNGKNLNGAYTGFTPFVYVTHPSYGFIGYVPEALPESGNAGLDALGRVMDKALAKGVEDCNQT